METYSSSQGKRKRDAASTLNGEGNDVGRGALVLFPAAADSAETAAAAAAAETAADATATESAPPLDKILGVLRRLLHQVMSKGLLPSFEEIKVYNLIWTHVTSYIFLYQRETLSKFLQDAPPVDEEEPEPDYKDFRLFNFHKMLGLKDFNMRVQPYSGFMTGKFLDDTSFHRDALFQLLEDCRSSFKETKPAPQVLQDVYLSSCHREQQLLSILHALEITGLSRGYAPPQCAADLQSYKEIRKWVVSFNAYSAAKYEFLKIFGKSEDLAACSWFHGHNRYPFVMEHAFIPPGHKLASALELIPEFKFLLSKCEGQLSNIFCTTNENKQVPMDADDGGSDTDSYYLPHLVPPQLPEQEIRDFRLKYLRHILSLCAQLASYRWKIGPTTREVRCYLHILEHVHSSLWLSEQCSGTCSYSLINLENNLDSPHVPSFPTPEDEMTRVECIMNICKLVDAIKHQSSATMMPTMEETKHYRKISKLLKLDLMVCSSVKDEDLEVACMLDRDHEVAGMTDKYFEAAVNSSKPSISGRQIARVKYSVACIYKKELEFLEELKKKYAGIVDMICCNIIPEEWNAKSPTADPCRWLDANRDQMLAKLGNYFQKQEELGKLDQAIVTLNGVHNLISDIALKLWYATEGIDGELRRKTRHSVALREVGNACCIYKRQYPSLGGTVSGIIF